MSNNKMSNKFLLITIIIIAVIILYNLNIQEKYTKIGNQQFRVNSEIEQIKIREGSDTFDDPLFSDVVFYMGDGTLEGEIGLEKCLKQCKNGNCVEYGVTGDAYCFPNDYESVKKKFLDTIKDKMSYRDF
jgi:hypothetical protein